MAIVEAGIRVPPSEVIGKESLSSIVTDARKVIFSAMRPEGMVAAHGPRWGENRFARDLFEVADDELEMHALQEDHELLDKTKVSILGFWSNFQSASGALPHEVAPHNPNHPLSQLGFFEGDGKWMVNRETIDGLVKGIDITTRYLTKEELHEFTPRILLAFDWVFSHMNDGLLSYRYSKNGGLIHQGWMDSIYGVLHAQKDLNKVELEGRGAVVKLPPDPITSVEVVPPLGRVLHRWAQLLSEDFPETSQQFAEQAAVTKEMFVEKFRLEDEKGVYYAHALDGEGNPVSVFSVNNAEILAFPYNGEFIVPFEDAVAIGRRLGGESMFDPNYGVRTFEQGHTISGDNYHLGANGEIGVFWPRATNRAIRGLRNLALVSQKRGETDLAEEFEQKALMIDRANINFFGQLGFREQCFVENGNAYFFGKDTDQESQHVQVWSASSIGKSALNLLAV